MIVEVEMGYVDTQIERSVLLSKVQESSDQGRERGKSKKVF